MNKREAINTVGLSSTVPVIDTGLQPQPGFAEPIPTTASQEDGGTEEDDRPVIDHGTEDAEDPDPGPWFDPNKKDDDDSSSSGALETDPLTVGGKGEAGLGQVPEIYIPRDVPSDIGRTATSQLVLA